MSRLDTDIHDWKHADEILTMCEDAYKELVGLPGVNPFFVLGVLASLRTRFDKGERTVSLYDDIEAEFDAL